MMRQRSILLKVLRLQHLHHKRTKNMKEITNNHLVFLVVVGIAVVFVGMFFSLSKITEIEDGMTITGMLSTNSTGLGTLTAEVQASTQISVPLSTVALGSLEPGTWNSSENASLTHGGGSTMDGWNNTNVTSNFTVQNDGSTLVDIEIYDTGQSAAGMGPFTGTTGCAADNTCFYVRCSWVDSKNTTGGDCTDSANQAYAVLPDAAGTAFASNLNFSDTNDQAYFLINATVPEDERAGDLTETITFAAVVSG